MRATERALDLAEDVAVVEMLMARGLVVMGDARPSLGKGAAALVESIDAALAELPPDVSAADAHAHVRNRLR